MSTANTQSLKMLSFCDSKTNQINYNSIDDQIAAAKLDPFEEVTAENPVFLVNGVVTATLGNVLTVIGKAKSKKSMFLSMWAATLLGRSNIKGFVSGLGAVKGVYFDTEQSKRHAHLQYRRIEKLLGANPCDNFSYYVLRPNSPLERLKMIEKVIYQTPDLKFAIIDGIADLLSKGANDEEQAIDITNRLMKWSLERNIHISTVLHQNKANSNAKGHMGSHLMQKSETVLSIEKDRKVKDVSMVFSPYSRGMDIGKIFFTLDKEGIPYILEDFDVGKEKVKSKNPSDYYLEEKSEIVEEVFRNIPELSYDPLKQRIRKVLTERSINIGERKCRDWITHFIEQKMIFQEGKSKPYKLSKSW